MNLDYFEDIRSKLALANLGKPALIGVVALIIMVAALAGLNLTRAATATTQFDRETAALSSQGAAFEESEGSVSTIFVHVSGAVRSPGLYEIEKGSRLAAAVEAAGGFTDEAAVDSVNLARVVEDGEHISVAQMQDASDSGQVAQAGAQVAGLVNINMATADQLQALPGIGPATAERIVSERTANGPFKTTSDLKRVSGIGDKKFDAIADLICV